VIGELAGASENFALEFGKWIWGACNRSQQVGRIDGGQYGIQRKSRDCRM
jgi:hypothetical protein